ncbi:CPBP family intramembrane metalloprotease [Tissierella creatinini]|nr:CPBP family intramembrane metalloprotease [Tissierella creatinini]TJX66686.1 CPBP family intramembrane metalloprotease [Soehngenia saccharolytica]
MEETTHLQMFVGVCLLVSGGKMERLRKPGIFEVNLLFMILGFGLLFLGYLVQSKEIYVGLLITEYVIILLPNILYLLIRRYSLKKIIKLNSISIKQILFSIIIMVFAYPVAVFVNAIVLALVSSFSSAIPTTVPLPTTFEEYIKGLFVIALAPGICEEVMFRGTLMSAYDRYGRVKSIIITSLLFGIFHFNLMNLAGPIFLGLVLGVLRHKTNSIIAPMIGHTINNGIALTIGYFATKYSGEIQGLASENLQLGSSMELFVSLISMGGFALFSLGAMMFFLKRMPETYKGYDSWEFAAEYKEPPTILKYIPVLIIILIFIVINIALLFFV